MKDLQSPYQLVEKMRAVGQKADLKKYKAGTRPAVEVTVRKVWISFSESYPYLTLFQKVFARLQQIPSGG